MYQARSSLWKSITEGALSLCSYFVQSFSYLHKLDLPSLVRTYPGGSSREAGTQNSIFVLHPKVLS